MSTAEVPPEDTGAPSAERRLKAQVGAYRSWAATPDRTARTEPGRTAFRENLERAVDPDMKLPESARQKMVDASIKAYYRELALRSVEARRAGRAVGAARARKARAAKRAAAKTPRRGSAPPKRGTTGNVVSTTTTTATTTEGRRDAG